MQDYDPKEAEPRLIAAWLKDKAYRFDPQSNAELFSIDTPPPTVSGEMHLGHAFSYAQQDFIVRYQRMRGKNVFYPFGFDDNGLATERFVEKKAKVKATKMPREDFIRLCLKETAEVEEKLRRCWQRLGISADWDIFYHTVDDWARKTSQRSFLELYRKGREYRKEAPTIWCPECQTAIAQVELQDKELESQFNDIAFTVNGQDLIIATTRPELLSSCVAVIFHPEDNRYKHLEGKKAVVPMFNHEVPVIADSRVSMEKGTGIVMCCTFGDLTDIEWWSAFKLPLRISITQDGKMNSLAGKYQGLDLREGRKAIIADLRAAGLLRKEQPIIHAVNVHERCGREIEFLVTKQWFIRYLDLKEEFIRMGREISWHPEHMRVRFEHWINGLQWDWCISRQRYFGVPFPLWYCTKCGEVMLAEDSQLPVDPLKHKPLKHCACGSEEFEPERDVLDTWATSSLTPMIALRWKDDPHFFHRMFPLSLRPQAHDIITFWAFNTVVKSYLHEGKPPWKHIMISGHALDPHGKKMSKSKGNTVDPLAMMEKYSADCLRFWAAGSKLGDDLPFMEKDFVTGKKFITKLWNASKFAMMHIKEKPKRPKQLHPIDQWLLSKLQALVKDSTETMEQFEYARTKLEAEKFFWQAFCDNYLELVKDRLYKPEAYPADAVASAKWTLHESLLTILKLFAPITPFITEEIFQQQFLADASIHTSPWPAFQEDLVDADAEKLGDTVVEIVAAMRKMKSEKSLSLKTAVKKLTITSPLNLEPVKADIASISQASEVELLKGDAMQVGLEF
ncbi:MAG: valine--tRNA ligase [Nanoarchaeota archaeon]